MLLKPQAKHSLKTAVLGALTVVMTCTTTCSAQDTASLVKDSLPVIKKDSLLPQRRHSLKPTGDFDQRFSFIDNEGVSIWGYRIGLLINDKFKLGIGGYFLNQNTSGVKLDRNGVPLRQLDKRLYFGTVYYEPFLFRKKRWEMSMLFELGYGKAVLDSVNKIRGRFLTTTEHQDFVPAGFGFSANFLLPEIKHLHFLSYLGVNTMIGVRKTIFESDLRYNYDGWYWSIGSAIFIDKIFTDIFKKNKHRAVAAAPQPNQ